MKKTTAFGIAAVISIALFSVGMWLASKEPDTDAPWTIASEVRTGLFAGPGDPKNVSEFFTVTTDGDKSCSYTCTSYINVTMIKKPAPTDSVDWYIELEFEDTSVQTKVKGGKDIFSGFAEAAGITFELRIVNSTICTNETVIYENQSEGTETHCQYTTIPFSNSEAISRIKNVNDTLITQLSGKKTDGTSTKKWGITIGDIYIDPYWNGGWGFDDFIDSSATSTAIDDSTEQAAWRVTPERDYVVTNWSIFSSAVATAPEYYVGWQADSGGQPSGTFLVYSLYTPASGSSQWKNGNHSPITLTAGNTYWLVVNYSSGTISTSDDWTFSRKDFILGATLSPFYSYPGVNTTNNSYAFYTGGSWTVYSTSWSKSIIVYNATEWLFGDSTTSGNTLVLDDANESLQQTFVSPDNMKLLNVTIGGKAESTTASCYVNVSISPETSLSTDWRDAIIDTCSISIPSDTVDRTHTCWYETQPAINKDSEYSIIYTTNCTSGDGVQITAVVYSANGLPSSISVANFSFQNFTGSTYSTVNDYLTTSTQSLREIPFVFTIQKVVAGTINITWNSPTTDSDHTLNDFVEYTINITCSGGTCGNAQIFLDPEVTA